MRILLGAFDPDLDPYADESRFDTPERQGLRKRFGPERVSFTEGVDRIRPRVPESEAAAANAVRGGTERGFAPALLADRTDLPPPTADAEGSEPALIDWGDGVLTLRAPDGLYLSVAEAGFVRASADEPGRWAVQETFRIATHGDGHLLVHLGTGGYVSVAADGVKVAADRESGRESAAVFSVKTVARTATGADVEIVVAGRDQRTHTSTGGRPRTVRRSRSRPNTGHSDRC